MRILPVALAVAFATVAAPPAARAATPPYSDTMCPRAAPPVIAFNDAASSADPVKIAGAAKSAAEAYRLCATDAQASQRVQYEPVVNYDKTRAAQFLVVAGRAEAVLGHNEAALAELRDARRIAADVAEWQPSSQTYHMSSGLDGNSADRNTDRNGSRYKPAAVEIVAAADAALAKLNGTSVPATAPAPAPSASPKP